MNILWVSGRRMGEDLASSTENFLSSHLTRLGNKVTLVSPGSIEIEEYDHIRVSDLKFPGLTSISGSLNCKKIVQDMDLTAYDVALVDWRYAYPISLNLESFGLPWAMIDRGPPANGGTLATIQKRFWRGAWRTAEKKAIGGFTVSEGHSRYVTEKTKFRGALSIIKAGTNANPFLGEKEDPREILKLVYIGRLDRSRGLEEVFRLSSKLSKIGIKHEVHICGAGERKRAFDKKSPTDSSIIFHGETSHNLATEILAKSHVGIMPMPNTPIWKISSPLKLSEYLAAGLFIIGCDHEGNRTANLGNSYYLANGEWGIECAIELSRRIASGWHGIVNSSVDLSLDFRWDKIAGELADDLNKMVST